jgi:hypothetical protein
MNGRRNMPRWIKHAFLKGRRVRDLTTGRFYDTKGMVRKARKAKIQFERQKEEKLASLKKATAASLARESIEKGIRRRAKTMSDPKVRARFLKKVREHLWMDHEKGVEGFLKYHRDMHSVKTVMVDGVECKYRKKDAVKDNKLSVVYMDCERESSVQTGVSVV